jgi:hypothetical protein
MQRTFDLTADSTWDAAAPPGRPLLVWAGQSKYLQRLRTLPPDRWFEWNLRRMAAIEALQRMAAMTPACPPIGGVP